MILASSQLCTYLFKFWSRVLFDIWTKIHKIKKIINYEWSIQILQLFQYINFLDLQSFASLISLIYELDQSRATHSATMHEVTLAAASVAPTTRNQRITTHLPPGNTNLDVDVFPHPNLILPSPRTIHVQTLQPRVPSPLLAEQPEMLHDFSVLKMNLDVQGANELPNGIYNIIQ